MASPIPEVEPVTTTDFPLSMAMTFADTTLISDIAAALLHRNIKVNARLHECARGRCDGIV
jgi:hypothetical protein